VTLFVDDQDFKLYVGDVREQLRQLPDESVHTVVTSPPYWGLRMYLEDGHESKHHELGLEPTLEQYVANMVDVFREVRRVMRSDATCFLNMGDSYGPDKQLAGVPWKLAFALQDDGWILRADIIWAKPNPMPESVTDRPTKAHEYVFLLTRSPRYFFDADAVREAAQPRPQPDADAKTISPNGDTPWLNNRYAPGASGYGHNPAGRNIRSVWEIATQPYAAAHFATFPEALPERCIKAGTSERGCCPVCGAPWERSVAVGDPEVDPRVWSGKGVRAYDDSIRGMRDLDGTKSTLKHTRSRETTDWQPSCDHYYHTAPAVPCTVLDPFMGSGTTALVARRLGRRSIGVELSPEYAAICAKRLQQLSLFAGATDG
jgi:DNA modification methylase